MHKFSDFAKEERAFDGDKIPITEVLNKEIVVTAYKLSPSKKKEGTNYVTLQIEYEGKRRVIFTGSSVLADQISKMVRINLPGKQSYQV